jgi:hypothetical protein
MNTGPWSTRDFERMSWHDVHLHGFRFEDYDPDSGSAELLLDIDYILAWEQSGAAYSFTVCQALLRFQRVSGFRMSLDYSAPSAGMCPFSISGIEREPIERANGSVTYRWLLPVSWPAGFVAFEAPSFTQTLVGAPRAQSAQSLAPSDRLRTPP